MATEDYYPTIHPNNIAQFDHWEPRNFIQPSGPLVAEVLAADTAEVSINIDLQDTVAPVMRTQFGVNANFRSKDDIVTRTHLYEELGAFRFPAGSGSNLYFWDCNLPDSTAIPTTQYCGTSSSFTDPDHFFTFKQNAQGEATIVVNYFYARYGTTSSGVREDRVQQAADYAASFVHKMNVQLGANVKYWEVGNECYGSWEHGYDVNGSIVTGKEYGQDFQVFAEAMKAVDSTIWIGAVLSHNNFDWNRQVMVEAQDHADFLIVHQYYTVTDANSSRDAVEQIRDNMQELQSIIENYTSKEPGHFPVCFTEFNNSGTATTKMTNGLFIADALAEIVRNRYTLSTLWVNEWNIDSDHTHGFLAKNDPFQTQFTPRQAVSYTHLTLPTMMSV